MTLLYFSLSSLFLSLHAFPNLRYLSNYFAQNYRAQYGGAMLVYLCGTPTWRLENSVNMWNLLWLSSRLIIYTQQASIFISTFLNTSTSEWAIKQEKCIMLKVVFRIFPRLKCF